MTSIPALPIIVGIPPAYEAITILPDAGASKATLGDLSLLVYWLRVSTEGLRYLQHDKNRHVLRLDRLIEENKSLFY